MATLLRPMTLGEILDRTFEIYRKRFLLFVGIAAPPSVVILALQLVDHACTHRPLARSAGSGSGNRLGPGRLVWLLPHILVPGRSVSAGVCTRKLQYSVRRRGDDFGLAAFCCRALG